MTVTVTEPVPGVSLTDWITGGAAATGMVCGVRLDGVTSAPFAESFAVIVMVPATVPIVTTAEGVVWEQGGSVNVTVDPWLGEANCTLWSVPTATELAGWKLSVNVAVTVAGNAPDRQSVTGGCEAEPTVKLTGGVPRALMVMVIVAVAVCLLASVTVKVTVNVPAVVGRAGDRAGRSQGQSSRQRPAGEGVRRRAAGGGQRLRKR